ncbi:SDR family NAD(P)-dependent oxidoreductase [Legionella erythra]|uniref:Oxidoreductase n=1 Tax=Legionella erythra TaxID=448 RepID=A0A0W0TSF0_LEGER|nr:SDR family NAD(P)-dependent oxidoreductase [Legionella erythra]KTC98408.1 oxidoreductase [Legionella erythra]
MKTLVITGASRGIGLATARYFLEKGWVVIGSSTRGTSGLTHPSLTMLPLDLAHASSIQAFVRSLPDFDLLINNAAVLLDWNQQAGIDVTLLKTTFDINVFGTIELTEACLDKLAAQGQIINMSSSWGSFEANDSPYQPHYKMSKTCLNMYTKLLAVRFPSRFIASFDPGWVKTDMGTEHAPTHPSQVAKELYALTENPAESGCFWHRGHKILW